MSEGPSPPIAVVGAGGSGIAMATALRRAGLAFEVLEARDGLGGTWRYDPDGDGSACYRSLVANTSKLRTQMSFRKMGGRPGNTPRTPRCWPTWSRSPKRRGCGRICASAGG